MTPMRIQRKRSKGWRMPPNTVNCTRPGPWGNPFRVYHHDVAKAVRLFEQSITPEFRARIKAQLRGRNLACFCPLNQPCHADVLLRIANAPDAEDLSMNWPEARPVEEAKS